MPDVRREPAPWAHERSAPPPLDARLAALAEAQHGVVSSRQLRGLGLSPSGISARVARGALHRVHRGVYAVGHPLLLGLGLEHAALLACTPGTARSHRSAGAGWQLRAWGSRRVEVTAGPGARPRPGLVVHRHVLAPEDVTILDGLLTTTVARTLFDLAEVLTREQHLRAWQEGERLRLIDVAAVRAVAERNPGRHALGVIRPLLATRSEPGTAETRSPLEADFLPWCAKHLPGIPAPQVNVAVCGYEVDAYWPGARLVVELDSKVHHDNDPAFERDREKWNALAAAGEAVFPLTARRLRAAPELVARQLTAILERRTGA